MPQTMEGRYPKMTEPKILPGSRKIKISDIKIGTRRREDMGNIQELADSLKGFGLINPVVVDDEWNLVAGGRRMAAAMLLGWEEIEARLTGELSDNELRALELEENVRRKDLTEYEKDKNLKELAQVVREQAIDESACVPGTQATRNVKGVKVPGSYRDISERIGIPEGTIREAEKHVAAVDKHPELKDLPKKDAIREAKELDEKPKIPTRDDIRMVHRYTEVVQKYPDLATYPHRRAVEMAKERDKQNQGNNIEVKDELEIINLIDQLVEPFEKERGKIEDLVKSIKKISSTNRPIVEQSIQTMTETIDLLRKIIKEDS